MADRKTGKVIIVDSVKGRAIALDPLKSPSRGRHRERETEG